MIKIEAKKGIRTAIGRLGENEARVVLFPVKDILDAFPGASFTMLNRRPGDAQAYPVNGQYVSVEGGELLWTVQSGDLAVQGFGECEIRAELGGAVVKTVIYQTEILRALDGAGTPPEPWESWVEDVTDAADRAEAAAALLENPGAEAETLTAGSSATASYADGVFHFGIPRGQKGNPGNPGDPGQPGQDGVSPTVAVEAITGGHQVTITDAEGDHTFDVMDGEQGDPGSPGQPGQDGYSPSASVTKSGSTATISITDKNGTTTAQVSDGDPSTIIDDQAGAGDTNKVWSADKTNSLKSAITNNATEESLLRSEMPGTSTTVIMDSNGNPTSIVHTANSATVRTDTFVWGTGTVTETRTLANGKYITITTNLETLAQTISAVQEVA